MIKHGVDLRELQPQLAIAYTIACRVWFKHTPGVDCVITSARDGVHGPNSLHKRFGVCRALDLRTNNLAPGVVIDIHKELKEALGEQFDVVLEDDHIHVEFDPKEPIIGDKT